MTPSPHNHSVRILDWAEARELARPLREAVFVHEQGVPLEEEWDEWDALSDHAIAFDREGRPIGTGRLLPPVRPDGTETRIGRMAVLRSRRGQGVGAALLRALMALAASRGITVIVLHAQISAAAFYRREGFAAEGEEFFEAGIAHCIMRRVLVNPSARN